MFTRTPLPLYGREAGIGTSASGNQPNTRPPPSSSTPRRVPARRPPVRQDPVLTAPLEPLNHLFPIPHIHIPKPDSRQLEPVVGEGFAQLVPMGISLRLENCIIGTHGLPCQRHYCLDPVAHEYLAVVADDKYTVRSHVLELQKAKNIEYHPLYIMANSLVIDTSLIHRQELLTDWATSTYGSAKGSMKRQHEGDPRPAALSPTYSQTSAGESSHSSFAAGLHAQPPHPHHGYMPAHPAYPPQHMQNARYNYPHPGMYYPVNESGEYNYATPSRPTHQPMPSMTYNGTTPQPPSATMLGRPFDGPMSLPAYQGQPQHTWQTMETPTKAPAQKKKRGRPRKERTTDQLPGSTPQTNAQRLSISSGDSAARATKRAKKDHVAQLPTPPSTGSMPYSNDLPVAHPQSFDMGAPPHQQRQQQQQSQPAAMSSLPPTPQPIQQSVHQPTPQPLHLSQASTGDELRPASTDAARRSALIITKDEQGRKLEVGSAATDPAEGSGQHAEQHSPRYITVPALVTNPAGLVSVDDNEVLQSAMEWLDNRPQTPRSTPGDSAPLRTPVMPHNDILADETTDTPVSRARKVDRRLQAFGAATPARESLLTATSRIDRMGRVVAVGKGFATTFLGIEDHARVVEEADMGDMFEIPAASSSLMERKPDWPDQEPPWALGSGRSGKAAREKRERDATIRRYLESASEESSDEEAGWRRTTFRNNKGKGVDRSTDRLNDMSYRKRTQSNWEAATTDATSALLLGLRNRNLRAIPAGVVGCLCGTQDTESRGPMIRCESCKTWHHLSCYNLDQVPHAFNTLFWCSACETRVMAAATTPARTPRTTLYSQSEERSSAFKRQASDIALAPSPLFPTFNQAAANSRTPLSRAIASASSPGRTPRARMLSYNEGEFWNTFEDAAPPSTPTSKADRFSTPKIDDVPFDVTSTPSRHIDFSFGQPSLFSLTPLGGRSRIPSNMLTDNMTPMRARNVSFGAPLTDMVPSRHDFLKDLNRGGNGHAGPSVPAHPYSEGAVPASPSSARWPHGLLGAPHVSPSPFGHRRTASGNKMSSLRSSSKAGLGFAMGDDGTVEEEDDEEY